MPTEQKSSGKRNLSDQSYAVRIRCRLARLCTRSVSQRNFDLIDFVARAFLFGRHGQHSFAREGLNRQRYYLNPRHSFE